MLGTLRRLLGTVLPALLAAALIGGCGGDDGESAKELLDRSFQSSIESADLTLEVEVALDGVDELQDPIELSLAGPWDSSAEGKLPSVDWELTVRAQDQSFNAGLTSTGDRAFVGFQGTDYEVDRATVAQFNRQLAAAQEQEGRNLSDFGVAARDWVVDAEEEGDEEVAGVETTHVSGRLDVARVLDDLNTVVQRASELGGQLGQQAPPELTDEQREQIEEVVDDPSFDAYVGKDDDTLRRLSADIEFDVPEDARERVGGLEGGRVSFSIEFANIGSAQPIEPPEDARPISELTQQLEGLIGGALGAPQQGGTAPAPESGGAQEPQTTPEKRQAYEECIKTDPEDESVQAFCEVLLQ